jgi:hypothetical protein
MKRRQKFLPFQRVRITDKMPKSMSHFDHDMDAIICGTYASQHGAYSERNFREYSLYLIGKNGKIFNRVSWYEEDQLTLIDNKTEENHRLVEEYLVKQMRRRD